MFEKSYYGYQNVIDPPKSPLKRGTLIPVPPFLRGASAVLGVSPMSDWRGLGGIYKCLKSQPNTFQTSSYVQEE